MKQKQFISTMLFMCLLLTSVLFAQSAGDPVIFDSAL